jgi:hypothetical protein
VDFVSTFVPSWLSFRTSPGRPRAIIAIAGLMVALMARTAPAQDAPDAGDADEPHPVYSTDERWVRPMLIGVGGLFVAAAGVGVVVQRMRVRNLVPSAASHEEDPGADRH